jgi:hypothetical protein
MLRAGREQVEDAIAGRRPHRASSTTSSWR